MYLGFHVIIKKYCILLSEDLFTFASCVDPEEMQHFAAFHLGFHCLQKYSFRGLITTVIIFIEIC